VGKDYADPVEVKGVAHLGKTGVDEYATAVMRFPGDILANVSTAVALEEDNTVRVFGTEGHLYIPHPWVPAKEGGEETIFLHRTGAEAQRVTVRGDRNLYAYEADVAAEGIGRMASGSRGDELRGQARPPAMTWADTVGNAKALTAWRRSGGLVYPGEA
jgi:predicted dehydrogenase